jgi:hypothetical protein
MLEVFASNDPTPTALPRADDRADRAARRRSPEVARDEHEALGGAVGWGALGALSVALLVLAVVVPTEIGVVMAAIGLAGLMVFRVAAMYGGWAPRGVPPPEERPPRDDRARSTAAGLRSWTPPRRRAPTLSRSRRGVS